jgi:hypothetical protein
MSRIFIPIVILILILFDRDAVLATQTFRFPLPELQGLRELPEDQSLTRRIGVFKNVSTVRIEIRGSATYGEETSTKRQNDTVAVRPGGYFTFSPACVPFYDAISLEHNSYFELPEGHFEITRYFIRGKSPSSFLVDGDGGFALTMHLRRSMIDWYPARPALSANMRETLTPPEFNVEGGERIR